MKIVKEIIESLDVYDKIENSKSYWHIPNLPYTKENIDKLKELARLNYFIINNTIDFQEVFYEDFIYFIENDSSNVEIWTYQQYQEFGSVIDNLYIYKKGDE